MGKAWHLGVSEESPVVTGTFSAAIIKRGVGKRLTS
jgi:hypothetical protein